MIFHCALRDVFVLNFFCSTVPTRQVKCSDLAYVDLYHAAAEARIFGNLEECVSKTHSAIEHYERQRENSLQCSKKCSESSDLTTDSESEISLLRFYDALVNKSACRSKCHCDVALEISEQVRQELEDGMVYDNLVRCYTTLGRHREAVSSAYSFLEYNPNNEDIKGPLNNALKICTDCADVKPWKLKRHGELAAKLQRLYSEEKYAAASEVTEQAIKSFLDSVEDCWTLCETFPLPTTSARDLSLSVTKSLIHILECKERCPVRLSYFGGSDHPRFLPELYNYLQYSYFKTGLLRETCEATQTFLEFYPSDEDMLHNAMFYADHPGVGGDWFVARKEAVTFLSKQKVQRTLLEKAKLKLKEQLSKLRADLDNGDLGRGITVTHDALSLNGTSRFVAEGFASEEECEALAKMGKENTVGGSGYNGNASPFTKVELFKGMDTLELGKLVRAGTVDVGTAEIMMNLSERVRAYVETYFELTSELYFTYTHLVCRKALSDAIDSNETMSHPVHGDNCLVQKDGTCAKQLPAYIWRDYSAILYLNDDFEGGEFIFGRGKDDREATVHPKCGRAAGFSSDNLHGVLALKRGERCVLAMWFTLDPSYREQCRPHVQHIVRQHRSNDSTATQTST